MDFEPENTGRMYLSVAVVKAMADRIGYVDKQLLADAERELAAKNAELDELHGKLRELETFKASIGLVLNKPAARPATTKKKEEPVGK
jgi:hypothetical protein